MNKKDFDIRFGGLKDGVHEFIYNLNNKFFDLIEYADISESDIDLVINLEKSTSVLVFEFNFKGSVELVCDRCLDEYDQKIDFTEKLYIKFGEEYKEVDVDLLILPRGETQINLLEIIYQMIIVNLPIKRVHPEKSDGSSGCNPEMLKRINGNVDEYNSEQEVESSIWNELKKLKNGTSKKKSF